MLFKCFKDGENSLICSVIHKMGQSLSHKQAYEMSLKMKNKLGNHNMGVWASQKAKAHQVGSTNKLTKSLWNCAKTERQSTVVTKYSK